MYLLEARNFRKKNIIKWRIFSTPKILKCIQFYRIFRNKQHKKGFKNVHRLNEQQNFKSTKETVLFFD